MSDLQTEQNWVLTGAWAIAGLLFTALITSWGWIFRKYDGKLEAHANRIGTLETANAAMLATLSGFQLISNERHGANQKLLEDIKQQLVKNESVTQQISIKVSEVAVAQEFLSGKRRVPKKNEPAESS